MGFEPSWLALREPIDHAARSGALADGFAAALGRAPRLIELACGTGSSVRYLSPRLGPDQWWLCLDHDRRLLDHAGDLMAQWGEARGLTPARPRPRLLELQGTHARSSIALIERDLRDVHRGFGLEEAHGVSASALLDLVSPGWADGLAQRLADAGLAALFALTYDGRLEWQPAEADDGEMTERFNRHQRTDKGFGPALGPDAAPYLAERLEGYGLRVELARSDWRIDAREQPGLLEVVLHGLIEAARAMEDDGRLADWSRLRRRQLGQRRLGLRLGHLDLLALPRAREAGLSAWPRPI